MEARVERARAAGAVGLIITLDWTFANGRDWGSPKIPERMNLDTMVRYAPQALVRPRWLTAYARTLRPPDLRVPNMVAAGQPAPTFFGAYAQWAATPPPAWDDVAWLRQLWGGPFLVKRITRIDDARRAVDAGTTAAATTWTAPRPPSGRCPRSPPRSAGRWRCCWTAGSAAAGTWARRSRW